MSGKKSSRGGLVNRLVEKLGTMSEADDDYYDDDDDYYDEGGGNIEPFRRTSAKDDSDLLESDRSKKPLTKQVPAMRNSPRKTLGADGMEVCVIKPSSIEEAREITETLLANRTVVLNLEGLDVDIAQRIIDFTSGSTYAINGNLQKISRYIFIVTPASVDISGDFQELLSGSMSQGGPQRV